MRIVFAGSHILHWRVLIPVAVELSRRGHSITVERSRPNWMGMPTFQMNWRPTHVTGVNKTSLAWLADQIGYGQEWQAAQDHIDYKPHFIPEEYDAAVSTTKDMAFLDDMTDEINGCMRTYAVGYQHFPVIMQVGGWPPFWEEIPKPFQHGEPFEKLHGFGKIRGRGKGRSCGFPHLNKAGALNSQKQNTVLIQHHGGYRGVRGYRWLVDLCRQVIDAGYEASICPHLIPGYGYDASSLNCALKLMLPYITGWHFVDHWWDVAGDCDLILTTGSSAAYEMWSVGLTNVFILGYLGGTRHEKFQMFPDLLVESPEALAKLLRGLPESAQATEPLTREVMEAYRSVHNGQGAKTAADVIEGKT